MTRDDVATVVVAELGPLLSDAGMDAADTTGGLKEPIDRALRAMGYAEDDLPDAEPSDAAGFLAMVTYQTLKAILARLALRTYVAIAGGVTAYQQQAYDHVKDLLAAAEAEVVALFGTAVVPGGGGLIALDLNYLDPACLVAPVRPCLS